MKCWHCQTELIWGGDHDIDEEEESEYLIVTNLSCPKCRSYFEVYYPKETEKNKDNLKPSIGDINGRNPETYFCKKDTKRRN